MSRLGELEHAARRLLVERGQLRQNLAATQQLLSQLVTAYDPAGGGGGGPHPAGDGRVGEAGAHLAAEDGQQGEEGGLHHCAGARAAALPSSSHSAINLIMGVDT